MRARRLMRKGNLSKEEFVLKIVGLKLYKIFIKCLWFFCFILNGALKALQNGTKVL